MDAETLDEAAVLLDRVAWVALAAVALWFAAGAACCLAARCAPRRRVPRRLARWSPAVVRRLAGVTITTSFALAAAGAPVRPAHAAVVAVEDEPVVRTPARVTPPAPAPPAPQPRIHVVDPGDSLWRIARAQVGERASHAALTHYWRVLVETNRPTLRSGDPSLIYPGEAITLPPVPAGLTTPTAGE